MASLVPLKDKKLMEVKLGELPSWIMMRNFTPSGIVGAFQRAMAAIKLVEQAGLNTRDPPAFTSEVPFLFVMRQGSQVLTGITTSTSTCGKAASRGLAWCWQPMWFSAIAFHTRNSNMSGDASTTEEGSLEGTAHLSITACPTPIQNSTVAESSCPIKSDSSCSVLPFLCHTAHDWLCTPLCCLGLCPSSPWAACHLGFKCPKGLSSAISTVGIERCCGLWLADKTKHGP